MSLVFALVGNQNCGKTTLFNRLTGSNQHVGNFPGVTVEKKSGEIRGLGVEVVDLPGIYSLSPYTADEVVTRDFLTGGNPDLILNIVDATNMERNLYLSLQLMTLGRPMVIALNMMDEVLGSGGTVDVARMEALLGVPVLPISAAKNEGIEELTSRAVEAAKRPAPRYPDICAGAVHKAIHTVRHVVEERALERGIPSRFAAAKLVEGDRLMEETLALSEGDREVIRQVVGEMERRLGTDREAALADMRYCYIEKLVAETVKKPEQTKEQERSRSLDQILTHKYFSIPIFIGIMGVVFFLTFHLIGGTLSDLMAEGIDRLTVLAEDALAAAGVNEVVRSLVIDGALTGVGSVLSFLPTILVLFFFLSLLEDSGYMARVAFVFDRLLRKIGLSGRSFVPLLIGFGCSVPAVMATRTLSSERDRKMTLLLIPFMSCSAKLPIYALFCAAFFPEQAALMMVALYLLGMGVGILVALVFKSTLFTGKPVPFVLELPAYRLPSPRSILLHMWEKAKDFLTRAFTVIFVAAIVIWFLQKFDFRFNLVANSGGSMLAAIGSALTPIFAPLGFGDWRASTALITGLSAKETVVSTLAVLSGAGSEAALTASLQAMFTPLTAFSFLVFTLLYMPCVAAMAAIRRELHSGMQAALMMVFQTAVAWLGAFVLYQIVELVMRLAGVL